MTRHPITKEEEIILKEYGINLKDLQDCALCQFEAGETILKQGSLVEHLFIVVQGKIKVYKLAANGKDLTLCYYISSGILGDVELVQEDKSASATSIVDTPSYCIQIPLALNRAYIIGNIAFMNQVAKGLSAKLLNSNSAHISSALYSGEERLCSYILMAEHNGLFSDVLTDVAQSIGISYRHLFRVLGEMCRNGVLEKKESGYAILNRQYLMENCAH
jgi:CRP-like cAMP-binding protein